jgi:hypothetical protein
MNVNNLSLGTSGYTDVTEFKLHRQTLNTTNTVETESSNFAVVIPSHLPDYRLADSKGHLEGHDEA